VVSFVEETVESSHMREIECRFVAF
jgi:hypothetical protein